MALYENPWAQGMGNLGTALFGSPQDDVAISQAQSQQALRQRRLREAEAIQQKMQADAAQQESLGQAFATLASLNPNDPAYQDQLGQAFQALGPALLEKPEAAFGWLRGGANLAGANPQQLGQTFLDPGDIMEFQDRQARDQRMGDVFQQYSGLDPLARQFGPDMGEWPNFAQQAAAAHIVQGIPVPQALAGMTGQLENVPVGESLYQINSLNPGQSVPLVDPRDRFRAEQGMAPLGLVSGRQVPQQGAGPSQRAPAPTQDGGMAGQAPTSGQGQTVSSERIRPVGETGVFGETEIETPAGGIRQLVDAEGRPVPLMEIIEYGSGFGASAQRLLNNTLGQASDQFFFEVPEIAQAQIAGLAADIRPLLTVSNRPSRWELEQIEKVLADPGAWRNPETNAARLRNLRADIEAGMQDAQQKLATQPMSSKEQQDLANAVSHAQGLLRKIGEPRRVSGAEANINRLQEIVSAFTRRGGAQGLRNFRDRAGEALSGGRETREPETAGDDDLTEEEREWLLQNYAPQGGQQRGGGATRMFDSEN